MMNGILSALASVMLLASHPASARPSECFNPCTTSADGVALVQLFEGFSPFIYKDTGGRATVGYGHLVLPHERIPEPLLGDAATSLLRADLNRTEKGLNKGLKRPLRQNRFDALLSFAYNVGVAACLGSSPWRYMLVGRHAEVPARLLLWVNVNGKPSKTIKVRRIAEGKHYSR